MVWLGTINNRHFSNFAKTVHPNKLKNHVCIFLGAQHRFTRNQLFQALKARGGIRPTSKDSQNALVEFVNSFINTESLTNSEKQQLKSTLQGFGVVLYRKWKKSGCCILKFTKANTAWLNQALIIPGCKTKDLYFSTFLKPVKIFWSILSFRFFKPLSTLFCFKYGPAFFFRPYTVPKSLTYRAY